jgi:TonB family protein
MGLPAKKLIQLMIEHDPASPEFRRGVQESVGPRLASAQTSAAVAKDDLWLWRDVFVQQKLPWGRFLESAVLHATAFALIWALSLAWLRQQKILAPSAFDRSSLITYSPEEYLPPLDTGSAPAPQAQTGDPAFAKQPILSVPREADNRSQTIVVPPDIKLDHDVPLPNIIASGTIVPMVPLDATRSSSSRMVTPDTQVIAPAPDANFARNVNQTALKSDIIPPPPEVRRDRARGVAGPETAVVEPPPEMTTSAKSHIGLINIGASEVVAPAPQLTLAEQHTRASRGGGAKDGLAGGVQAVGPPPSVTASGGRGSQGRLIALGIHPVTPTGPVAVPGGNRRGTFAANPQGKPGAAGTPNLAGSKSAGFNGHGSGSLPAGLHVGAVPGATGPIERNGRSSNGDGNGGGDEREMASLSSAGATPGANSNRRTASAVSDDKITDVDHQVFGDRRFYAMTLNMPNLNSFTGSWVIRFAEMQPDSKQGALLAPVPTEKTDPGYPLELMRTNVHGMVTLYAVIHSDGRVGDIRVLNSPDERLDAYAASALARWKFLPAERAGKPVALEAVVVIPFRVRKTF